MRSAVFATGVVESTVNQVVSRRMVKKQQMRWSHRGAHLLLRIRTHVLNGDWEDVFRRWYPGFRAYTQPIFARAFLIRPSSSNPMASAIRGVSLSPEYHLSFAD